MKIDQLRNTILYKAVANGHEDIVRLILEKGVDVNIRGAMQIDASKVKLIGEL